MNRDPLQAAYNAIDAECPEPNVHAAKARALMYGYHTRWKDAGWTTLEVEKEFHLPICNPDTTGRSRTFTWAGKTDAIAVNGGGGAYLVEHKTTSASDIDDPASAYYKRLSIDGQVSSYVLANWMGGQKVAGTLYDVIRRPGTGPRGIPDGGAKAKRVPKKSRRGFGDQEEIRSKGTYYGDTVNPGIDLSEENREMIGARLKYKDFSDQDKDPVLGTQAELFMYGTYWGFKTEDCPDADGKETFHLFTLRLCRDVTDNPDKYYQRRCVNRMDSDLDEYSHELWDVACSIRNARARARRLDDDEKPPERAWYRNDDACAKYNTMCQYLPLCAGGSDSESDEWEQRGATHSELDNAPKDALTYSRMKCFKNCPRLHYYRYELGIQKRRSEESEALYFGNLMHKALEAWWGCFMLPKLRETCNKCEHKDTRVETAPCGSCVDGCHFKAVANTRKG